MPDTQLSDRGDSTAVEMIESIYARMGLGSEAERGRFLSFSSSAQPANFDVVISTTSDPFNS